MIYIPSKILKLLQSDSLKLEQNEELIELLPKTFNTVKLKPNTKCPTRKLKLFYVNLKLEPINENRLLI